MFSDNRALTIYLIIALLVVVTTLVLTSRTLPINATPTETSTTKLHGLIISLQFFDNGTASWIVSGRWRVDINYDINGVVPQSIKNLNVSLGMISADGLVTKKYALSDFKESTASYDKQTHMATINGTLRILMGGQAIDNVRTTLKFFERNIITIRLDPSKTNNDFGNTPIYGVKR